MIAAAGLIFTIIVISGSRTNKETEANIGDAPTNVPAAFQGNDSSDETLFLLNGQPMPMSAFGYYLYNSFVRLESRYETPELDFNLKMTEDMTLGQYVIKNAVDGLKFNIVVDELAKEFNIDRAATEDEVDEYLTTTIAEAYSGDVASFQEQLAMMGTNLESFREIMISQRLGSYVFEHYYGENGAETVKFSEHSDRFATVSYIFLLTTTDEPVYNEETGRMEQKPLSDEVIEHKRALAETILERLNGGEDFFELLNEYGEDPGIIPENNPNQRYTFQRKDMAYEFSDAAFSLEAGEYSDIVELPYGFYMIHRLPLDVEEVARVMETREFLYDIFNQMLDALSSDYVFEPTPLFETTPLDTWYMEYKSKNFNPF